MTPSRGGRIAGAALAWTLIALAAAGTGCGKKTGPAPPERRLPMPVASLAAAVEGPAIVLTWVNPTRRVDDTVLRDLEVVQVFRREEEPGTPVKPAMLSRGRVVGYERIASIRLERPAPATIDRLRARLVDADGLTFGRRYVYVATAVDSTGRSSAPSPRAVVTFLAAPRAPGDLAADAGDSRVHLTWSAPSEYIDGKPVTGPLRYVVLRGQAEGALSPVTSEPVPETAFDDTGLTNDTDYRYAVLAVRSDPDGTARGEASPTVTASPTRTTPPAAPAGLVAIAAGQVVRLAWDEVKDPRVVTYAVYRAEPGGPFARVGTTPAPSTVFVDQDVRPGRTYRYRVTALDGARRPNESAYSNEISITVE